MVEEFISQLMPVIQINMLLPIIDKKNACFSVEFLSVEV